MATVSAHLPDGSELEARFFSHVKTHYRNKPGPFIRELIERALETRGTEHDPVAPNIMLDLVGATLGARQRRDLALAYAAAEPAIDQARELEDVLRAYVLNYCREHNAFVAEPRPAGVTKATATPAVKKTG